MRVLKLFWATTVALTLALTLLPVSFIVVAVLLLTKWDGTTTVFGNRKYPRALAAVHYAYPTRNEYWREWRWYCLRNAMSNLSQVYLARAVARDEVTETPWLGGTWYESPSAWCFFMDRHAGRVRYGVKIGWKLWGYKEWTDGKALRMSAFNPFVRI